MSKSSTLTISIPASARFASTVRERIEAFAACRVSRPELDDLLVAIGEALANAIEHSNAPAIELECEIAPDKILATVKDRGDGFRVPAALPAAPPHPFSEAGRGLSIMRRCTDIFRVHSAPGCGTAVTLGRYLRAA